MIRKLTKTVIVLLLYVISLQAQSQQPTPEATPKTKYQLLLEKAKAKDKTINFTELRNAFYESPDYHPNTPMLTYRPLNAAIAQKNYEQALQIAESVFAKNFVEVNAHMAAQIAYQETGNAERAEFHKFMVDGLLNSIKSVGDGKTVATAFVVISINEEYGLIRSLGLRPIKQSLIQDKGHFYDAITVVDPQTNQESMLYFNVDKSFNWQPPRKP
jgi:tetratricopeptide (TPR) repeat protein